MASTLIALIGDSTRDQVRTRAMALMGVVLGVSFGAGFLVGPLVSHQWGVPAVFALSAVLSVIGVLAFEFAVPSRLLPHVVKRGQRARPGAPGSWSWAEARSQLTEPSLLVLDGGIFVLHAGLTALFLVLPFMLRDLVTDLDLWKVYTPALLAGMVSMITASHFADRRDIARRLLVIGPAMCVTGMACIAVFQGRIVPLVVALTLYVAGFAMTEPVLASLLTRYTGRGARGTAAGVFNMVQFSGAFLGGTLGGWLLHFGRIWPVLAMAALAAGWMLSVRRLADPDGLANSEIVPPALDEPAWVRVHRALIAHAGVLEADWQPGGPVRVRHWPRRVTPEELVALVGQAALASAEDRR
jgi:MFS family permease